MNKKSILLVVAMLVATAITCVTRDAVIHYREAERNNPRKDRCKMASIIDCSDEKMKQIESAIQARDEKESIYQSVTKAVEKFSTEELVAYQFRSAEKSVKDTLRYFAIEHIVQEIILEKALKRG